MRDIGKQRSQVFSIDRECKEKGRRPMMYEVRSFFMKNIRRRNINDETFDCCYDLLLLHVLDPWNLRNPTTGDVPEI